MESIWQGKEYYLQAYNLKKATQIDLFFQMNKIQIQWGLCEKEEAMLIQKSCLGK